MRSVKDSVLSVRALDPIAQTAAAKKGLDIDTLGYNSCDFVVQNGAATGTPDSYTVDAKVQESVDTTDGHYSDVSGATITTLTADGKSAVIGVEGLGTSRKRYLRVVITPAFVNGTSPKALVGAVCNLGRAYHKAVGNVT